MHPGHSHRDYRQPPERKSMHARIVRDLGMRIVAGTFKPGDRLPGESALLADYEVSRPVLREATRVLVAKGLVLSRQRAGAIVRPRSEWHLLDPDVLYWLIPSQPPPRWRRKLRATKSCTASRPPMRAWSRPEPPTRFSSPISPFTDASRR